MSAPSVSVAIAGFIGSSILPCVVYGINSTLFFMTANILWKRRKAKEGRIKTTVMATYLFLLFALTTMHLVADAIIEGSIIAQLVDSYLEKAIPPEPYAAQAVNIAAYVVMAFMTDGLLLWRCWVLYSDCAGFVRWTTYVIFFLLTTTLLAFGIMLLYITNLPIGTLPNPPWLIRFISLAHPFSILATNFVFAVLIVARLIYRQRNINRLMGKHQSAQYTGIATMVIESASINVAFQLLCAISLFISRPEVQAVFNIYFIGQTQALATLLIVFRVARGKAWAEPSTDATKVTQLRFGGASVGGRHGHGVRSAMGDEESIFIATRNHGSTFTEEALSRMPPSESDISSQGGTSTLVFEKKA